MQDDYMSDSYLEMLRRAEETRAAGDQRRELEAELRRRRRFALRLPSSLYKQVAEAARGEGISMNTYVSGVLAAAVRWRADPPTDPSVDEAEPMAETPEQRAQREREHLWRIFR
jgi:hypothetical protein